MRSKFKWIFTLLMALSMQFSFAQEKTVTGVVSDKTGPLPGANIVVKGTTRSAQTDFDGKYSIKAKAGEVLVISFTGYNNSSVTVGAANNYVVTLTDGIKLEEVVVEGYRNTTKGRTVLAQQTVSAKTIENRPNATFIQTLQGQVAGLNITSGSGQPGSGSSVVIRGAGSISGNTDPLYVIDGIPTNASNFRSINPSDIESATVLKDAAATAIYGNRGSGGVIVIKTKRGGTGEAKTSFRFSTNTGYTELQSPQYSLTNSKELLTLERAYGVGQGFNNPVTGAPYTDAEIAAYGVNTDWVNYFFRKAKSTDYQLSVESSGKNLNSYTSVSVLDQEGILINTGLKRFTLRNNLSGKSNNDKFTYSTNISLGFSKSQQASNLGTGNINQNYVLGATLGAPYIGPGEYTGSQQLLDLYNNSGGSLLYTPLMLIDKSATFSSDTDEIRMSAGADVSYEIFKNVTGKSRTSFENIETRLVQWQQPISFNSFLFLNPGQEFGGTEAINYRREFRFNQLWQLGWAKTYAEKHSFSVLGNAEYYGSQVDADNQFQRGLNPATFVPGTGSGYLADIAAHDFYGPTGSASRLKYNLISYFGVFDYDFNDKYGVVGTYRYDGTSRFGTDYRWGNFWSVAGRWNINKEEFMKNSGFQVLKLRASYGETGNERIEAGTEWIGTNPAYFLDTYSNNATVTGQYNGAASFNFNLGAADLQWETTTQWNIGLDFEFFKNRARGTIDYYNRLTTDLLNVEPISPITGQPSINKNSDIELTNRGIEVSLAYDVVRNDNFKFTLRGNVSKNNNEVNNIQDNNGQIVGALSITQNGGQLNEFYVYPYAGVNPANGNLLFTAADGSLTETPSVDTDRRATGKSSTPIYQGGFGLDLDYKGFFATTNFTFVKDVTRFDYDLDGLYDPGQLGQFVVTDDLLNAWTPTNTNTNVPSLNASNLGAAGSSDRFLKDASYVRLRFLQVGYRLPKQFIDKTFMSALSFYVQGENLYTWTKWQGFDAESPRGNDQGQYPTPRIFTFGMDLKF
jgi:TonB-linked SusC/RagA family outer membrane protein